MSALAIDDPDYNALVIEHFENPRNAGQLAGPRVVEGAAGKPDSGVHFKLTADVTKERIVAMRFEAYGCPHCIAAASYLTQELTGASLQDLERWSWQGLADVMSVPTAKRGRLLILEDAVRALSADWRRRF